DRRVDGHVPEAGHRAEEAHVGDLGGEHAGSFARTGPRGEPLPHAPSLGNRSVISAPCPGGEAAATEPPLASTVALVRARPRPVPRPSARSVKKRSKMRGSFSGGMPGPVSVTTTT